MSDTQPTNDPMQQAAEAPGVATVGPDPAPDRTAQVEAQHQSELDAARAEHNDRRVNPQLPDPHETGQLGDAVSTPDSGASEPQAASQAPQEANQPQGDIPADQLAADGDQVVGGVDEGQEGTPSA